MGSSSKHRSGDTEGRERTIAELEDRIRILENELRLKHGRAEDSLQLMQYILDQARDEASLAGPDGRFYYVNDAKCLALGYTHEELQSMHVWDVDSDLTEEKWASVWRDIRDHGFKMFETWHRTKHGQLFRTEVSATCFDFHGQEYLCAFVRDITERKRAEEALRAREEKYRELVENANSIILRFDMQGNLTFFNEYAERLLGYSRNEVIGRNVVGTIVPPSESTGRSLDAIIEVIKRDPERYRSNVNENVCKNGDRVWIAWTNKAIRDERGNLAEILSVGNDITDRKRMEDALRVSEERLRRACSAGRIGLYEWNVDRDRMYFNPEASELYGCEPDSPVTYEEWLPRVHPEDRGMVERRFARNQENARREPGFPSHIEYRVVHGNGEVLWLEVQSTYALEGGDLIVRGVVRDVTERKQAEEALKLTQASIDLAANEITWIMPDGEIVYVNDATCRALQRPRDELLGMYVWDIDPKYTRETWQEHWQETKKRGAFTFETIHNAKGGRRFPVEVSVNYVKSDGREFNFAYIQDITGRKRAEEALQVSEERLRRASRAGGVGLYEWNLDGGTAYLSPEAYELYGLDPNSPVTYETWLATVHPDDREITERAVTEAREKARNISGVSTRIEFRTLRPDGAVQWLLVTATCSIEGGDLIARGAVRDITERKHAEEALKLTQASIDLAANEIAWVTPEGKIVYANDATCRALQRSRDELLGMYVWDIDPKYTGEKRQERWQKVKEQGSFTYETIHYAKEGRGFPVEVSVNYVKSGGREFNFAYIQDIADRKRAEAALRESEARYRALIDNSPLGILTCDLEGNITSINPQILEIMDSQYPEFTMSMNLLEFEPMVKFGLAEILRDCIVAGEGRVAEKSYTSYWGKSVYMRLHMTPLRDNSGQIYSVLLVMEDITERKMAEETLLESERNLAWAQAISHIGNWHVDPATDMGSGSDELLRILGIPRQEMFSYSWFIDIVHPDDRPMARAVFEEVKRTHHQKSFDFRIVRPDGEERYIFLDGEFTFDREGNPRMFGTMQDITERKKIEKELWMNQEKFRVLADTSFGLIAVHSCNNLLYVNDQAIPLTGYTKEELLSMPFWELFTEDCRELVKKRAFDRLAGESVPASYEATILTRDGKIKWVNMTAGLFYYEDKPAIISTMFDITDRKNAEKELKEANAQAELYVDLMAHDINNFNLVARGYLELMDGMADGELKQLISKPMEAIDSSSRLIRNVQKLQRARSGEPREGVLDLGLLVEEVAGQFTSIPGDKHVDITCDTVKGVRVRADELLRDVFVNLIGNAIKHSPRAASIDIRVAPEERDGRGYCRVTIDDNGPGVPDDMKEKVFDRLKRGDTKAKGSGLGLYLVKSLVESYGGRVWVEDRVKGDHTQGARFVVILPSVNE